MKPTGTTTAASRSIDVPGAALVAVGMFLLVFALSEGATYGWWEPLKDFTIAGHVDVARRRARSRSSRSSFVVVGRHPRRLLRARAVEGAPRTATRCSSSATSASRTFRYGLLTGHDRRDGPARLDLRAAGVPAGRQAPHRRAERLLAAAVRHLHHHRRAARRPPDPHVRDDDGRAPRARLVRDRHRC